MSRVALLIPLACTIMFFGCYHVTVETGLKPSTEVIEEPFAACWIYGLVPPKTIETMAKCPHGVAKVETQLSFLNQLVGGITFGIFTPVCIKVTCAEKSMTSLPYHIPDIALGSDARNGEFTRALMKAADIAVKEHRTAYVEY